MFQSEAFLNTYLPLHFSNGFSDVSQLNPTLSNGLRAIKFVSEFLALSHKLYAGAGQQKQFSHFIKRNFMELNPYHYQSSQQKMHAPESQGIMTRFLPKLNSILVFSLKLYTRIIYYETKLREHCFDTEEKLKLIQDLSDLCQKIRFQFELKKMAEQNQDIDFDAYIQQIIQTTLCWNLSISTQAIIQLFLKKDQANISDQTRIRIQKNIQIKRKKVPATLKQQPILEKCSLKCEHSMTTSSSKIEQEISVSQEKKTKTHPLSKAYLKYSSRKNERQEDLDNQRQKRLTNYFNLKKYKPIIKERTIYQQRKGTYTKKKMISNYLYQQFKGTQTETSLNSSFVKECHNFQMESQNQSEESVLVQSTPMQHQKKVGGKPINYQLSFFQH